MRCEFDQHASSNQSIVASRPAPLPFGSGVPREMQDDDSDDLFELLADSPPTSPIPKRSLGSGTVCDPEKPSSISRNLALEAQKLKETKEKFFAKSTDDFEASLSAASTFDDIVLSNRADGVKRNDQVPILGQSKLGKRKEIISSSGPATVCKFSGLKVKDRRVHETLLDDYFKAPRTVYRLPELKLRIARNQLHGDWVTIGVLATKSSPKTSKNGGRFMVWYLSNLQGCSAALFLFGDAYQQHWKESEGVVIAVLNPKTDVPASESSDRHDDLSFSIQKAGQLLIMGASKDFGKCQSVRKDGQPCGNVVNLSECPYCQYHMASELKKLSSRRPNLNNMGPTGAPRMLTVGMKQSIRQVITGTSRGPVKGPDSSTIKIIPPADLSHRIMHSATKRRMPERAALSEVLQDPKMINMLNKTRDGKKSIAAAHLKIVAGLQDQARAAGTTISDVLRKGPALLQRSKEPDNNKSGKRETELSNRAKAVATHSIKPSGSSHAARPEKIPNEASCGQAPHSASATRKSTSNPSRHESARSAPVSGDSESFKISAARRSSTGSNMEEWPGLSSDTAGPTSTSSGKSNGQVVSHKQRPVIGSTGMDKGVERPSEACNAALRPASKLREKAFIESAVEAQRPKIGSTPVQSRTKYSLAAAQVESPSVQPPTRSVMLLLDDDEDEDGPSPAPLVRCNQLLTPKALETRILAAVELRKAGGLECPDPTRVTKNTTLTIDEMAERKRKRALLEAAQAAVREAAADGGGGEPDDGSLDLGWIASKRAARRSAVDVAAAMRNQRLAALFPDLAQVVCTREGEEMLSRGSANSHLALQVKPSLLRKIASNVILRLALTLFFAIAAGACRTQRASPGRPGQEGPGNFPFLFAVSAR